MRVSRKLLFVVLAGLLMSSCSRNVKVSVKELEQKFIEYAQNTPDVNADGNITFKYVCSYPDEKVEVYGKPIQSCFLDEMTDREVSLVAELIWAARIKQERGRIYITELSQNSPIQQMMDWYGNDIEDSTIIMNFQRMERVIPRLRDYLNNKMRENHVQELVLYDVLVDSTYSVTAVVDNHGNIDFSGMNSDVFEKAVLASFSRELKNEISLEDVAQSLSMAKDVVNADYDRFSGIARSFLLFQIKHGNKMFLNGEKIRGGTRDAQIDSYWENSDSASSFEHYIYDWCDSIFSTEASNSIITNGFNIRIE